MNVAASVPTIVAVQLTYSATLAVRPTCKSHEYRSQQFRYDFSHMLSPKSVTETQRAIVFAESNDWRFANLSLCSGCWSLFESIFFFCVRFVPSILLLIHIAHENENNCDSIGVMFGSLRTKELNHVLQNWANKCMRIGDAKMIWQIL